MDAVTRLANESWEALFRAQATLAREFARDGEWVGLPPSEYGVLYALAGANGGLRITELIDDALLTQAACRDSSRGWRDAGSSRDETTPLTHAPAGSSSRRQAVRCSDASAGCMRVTSPPR